MKYTGMEYIRQELVSRGMVESGLIGKINPTEIKLEGLEIRITEQSDNYMLLEDERNNINIMTDNKHNILGYVIGVSTYN